MTTHLRYLHSHQENVRLVDFSASKLASKFKCMGCVLRFSPQE